MVQSPHQNRYNDKETSPSSFYQADLARITDIKYIHRVFLLFSTFEILWRIDGSSWQRPLLLVAYLLRFPETVWCLFAALYYLLGILFSTLFLICFSPRPDISLSFL